MTIDDSTLLAQAISSSTKRLHRLIHINVNRTGLFSLNLLWNLVLVFLEWRRVIAPSYCTSRTDPFSTGSTEPNSIIVGVSDLAFTLILPALIAPLLVTWILPESPQRSSTGTNALPTIDGTAIAPLISLLPSFCLGCHDESHTSSLAVLLLAASSNFGWRSIILLNAAFIYVLRLEYAPWALYSMLLALARTGNHIDRQGTTSSTSRGEYVDGAPSPLLRDISPRTIGSVLKSGYQSITATLRSCTTQQVVQTSISVGAGLMINLASSLLGFKASSAPPSSNPAIQDQFLRCSLVLLPTLLDGGLVETIGGVVDLGLGSVSALAQSVAVLGTILYFGTQDAVISSSYMIVRASATLVCAWLWLYRIRSRITLQYAIPSASTFAISHLLSQTLGHPAMDLSVPFILLRLHLASLPPSPRPQKEAEEEKRKPDPQKGLTPVEERNVDLVLEFGWYVLLGTAWAFWRT